MDAKSRMPVLFIGHGSPTNAIENNEFTRAWKKIAEHLPKPKAILSISAHWQTAKTAITGSQYPPTIHDFWGFPKELFEVKYPAPGSPWLVEKLMALDSFDLDLNWGLDHGTWSVLNPMYPQADIPVLQFSLADQCSPEDHFLQGEKLKSLREEGVLILASGNIVHNLRLTEFRDVAYDWAVDFDQQTKERIVNRSIKELVEFKKLGKIADLSINSAEHYLPLLYALAASEPDDEIQFFCEKVTLGSISMRCVQFG